MAAPNTPGDFVVVPSLTGTRLQFHWSRDETHTPGSAGFSIDRSEDDGATWSSVVSKLDGALTSWIDDTVTPNTNYKYRVSAANNDGSSPYALVLAVTTPTAYPDVELALHADLQNGISFPPVVPPAPVGGYALPGLIGWALTAGPRQTLSSAGVITSGPAGFSEVNDTFAYGANGASSPAGGGILYNSTPLSVPENGDLLIAARVLLQSGGLAECLVTGAGPEYPTLADFLVIENELDFTVYDALGNSVPSSTGFTNEVPGVGTPVVVFAWYTPSTDPQVYAQVSGTAPQAQAGFDPATSGVPGAVQFSIQMGTPGGGDTVTVRDLRIWIGPNAATLAADATFRSWLANGGAGRTDAELAAYTP